MKVGITLRFFSGGSALDLGVMFNINSNYCHQIFYEVLLQWIINTNIGNINIDAYLSDIDAMKKVSNGFASRSNGIFKGAIGDIDGWLVRVVRPNLFRNFIKNPTDFFQKRGFML